MTGTDDPDSENRAEVTLATCGLATTGTAGGVLLAYATGRHRGPTEHGRRISTGGEATRADGGENPAATETVRTATTEEVS